jgi:predicted transcriptional regulator
MTTTIRLDKELRARIATAAERQGKSPHAFMVDALAKTVQQAEAEAEFHRVADERWEEYQRTGKAIPADEVNQWILAKVRGKKTKRPVARRLDK